MNRFRFWYLPLGAALLTTALPAQQPEPQPVTEVLTPAPASPVQVAVLGYGSFAVSEGMRGITATTFRAQMEYLKEQGIKPVSLQEFIDWHQGQGTLPERCVLITLDEADVAAYSVAFPVLREYGFPFVVFADGRNFKSGSASLSSAQLIEMQQAGGAIGSRTMTRPQTCDWQYALQAGPDAAQKMAERELGLSAQRITANFGSCDAFSYPRGYANELMVENLAIYGYKIAFGCVEGKVQRDTPAYLLPRYMVNDMPGFAHAVNFGSDVDDSRVLHLVRSAAAKHLPVSQPVEVVAPDNAPLVSSNAKNAAADAAVLPPLPPALNPVADHEVENDAPAADAVPIPMPVLNEEAWNTIKVPELTPRPVSTLPAAGVLVKRSATGDWVTREFPQPEVPREQTRVAVLGYHNFSNTKPVSDMRMRTSEFCQQMQYIKDAGLTVITMQDFLEWLLGNRCLPERCVLITIDDGWRSVYTDAFPVLKAYGYPFTLFLYTTYISGRGQSMSPEMIQEMMASGATIGSHSTTHLYPSQWKRFAEDSPEYAAQLRKELPDSVEKLKALFGNCSTYCYPGGYNTPPMLESLRASGVRAAFTVLEQKVTTLEDPLLVHRYMVFGTDSRIFRRAVNFDGEAGVKPTAQGITEARKRAESFFPKAFEAVKQEKSVAPVKPSALPVAPKPAPTPAVPVLEDIPEPNYTTSL